MPYHHIKTYIDDYIDGRLSPDEKEQFEKLLASDPASRKMYEHERMIRALLKKSTVPDPGEKYWQNLENNILDRTITRSGDNPGNANAKRKHLENGIIHFLRQAAPLAAAVVLFIVSVLFSSGEKINPMMASAQSDGDTVKSSDERPESEHRFLSEQPEFSLLTSIATSPPGTFGRQLTDGELSKSSGRTY